MNIPDRMSDLELRSQLTNLSTALRSAELSKSERAIQSCQETILTIVETLENMGGQKAKNDLVKRTFEILKPLKSAAILKGRSAKVRNFLDLILGSKTTVRDAINAQATGLARLTHQAEVTYDALEKQEQTTARVLQAIQQDREALRELDDLMQMKVTVEHPTELSRVLETATVTVSVADGLLAPPVDGGAVPRERSSTAPERSEGTAGVGVKSKPDRSKSVDSGQKKPITKKSLVSGPFGGSKPAPKRPFSARPKSPSSAPAASGRKLVSSVSVTTASRPRSALAGKEKGKKVG